MKLIDATGKGGSAYEVLILADTFAPMSVLYVTDPEAEHKFYIANESGQFVGQ